MYSKSEQTLDSNWKMCLGSFIPPKIIWIFVCGQNVIGQQKR